MDFFAAKAYKIRDPVEPESSDPPPMRLGAHDLRNGLFVAPMAGVTDRPFRVLCRRFGAGLASPKWFRRVPSCARRASRGCASRMRASLRRCRSRSSAPIPAMMAEAARYNVAHGAQIIDINMGCPAKKVCNVPAGSALLRTSRSSAHPGRGRRRGPVPVTLKIRTGPSPARRNAARIARIAESAGVELLAIHGRTRACGFGGNVEYDTIAEVKSAVRIPVIANGDLETPQEVARVLAQTGADGVMIGRAAHGRPWIFRQIEHYLATGALLPAPGFAEVRDLMLEHLEAMYALYGSEPGARIARKHVGCMRAIFRAPKRCGARQIALRTAARSSMRCARSSTRCSIRSARSWR
jgi:tRNA-dihydrouridine synthase B